jgi:hypothetical protein
LVIRTVRATLFATKRPGGRLIAALEQSGAIISMERSLTERIEIAPHR